MIVLINEQNVDWDTMWIETMERRKNFQDSVSVAELIDFTVYIQHTINDIRNLFLYNFYILTINYIFMCDYFNNAFVTETCNIVH